MILKYNDFLNENKHSDILIALDFIKNTPNNEILRLKDSISEIVDMSESMNEGVIGDFFYKLKDKFKRYIDDKFWKYIINKKRSFYLDLLDKLDIFDITNFNDILVNHPTFKLESLYLAGGMDKAVDVGAGWRHIVENVFETYKTTNSSLPKISIGEFGDVNPCRVVDGIYLDMFLKTPSKTKKLYTPPLILNPVRKEVDRTKNKDFALAASKYKSFTQQTNIDDYEPTISNIRKTLTDSIEPDDEHLVRLTDATLLGLNTAAASGTFGELQTLSFLNKPIFVWMTSNEWSFSDFSMWTFPHITKIARNKNEMEILVKTMINFSQR